MARNSSVIIKLTKPKPVFTNQLASIFDALFRRHGCYFEARLLGMTVRLFLEAFTGPRDDRFLVDKIEIMCRTIRGRHVETGGGILLYIVV